MLPVAGHYAQAVGCFGEAARHFQGVATAEHASSQVPSLPCWVGNGSDVSSQVIFCCMFG